MRLFEILIRKKGENFILKNNLNHVILRNHSLLKINLFISQNKKNIFQVFYYLKK